MSLATIARRNVRRNKLRFVLTISAVAMTLCAFVLLRTVVRAYHFFSDHAAQDRLLVMHRAGIGVPLPVRYAGIIDAVPGVRVCHFGTQSSFRSAKHGEVYITGVALDAKTFLDAYDEIAVDAAARDQWLNNRSGALVGEVLAERLGVETGDTLSLVRDEEVLELRVEGLYRVTRPGWAPRTNVVFHFELLNASLPEAMRDRTAVMVVRVDPGAQPTQVAAAIDSALADQSTPVVVRSEQAQTLAVLSRFSSILSAIDIASVGVVLLMLLIVANTMAMGIRERTREFAVLRAVGFTKGHILMAIGAEALLVGLAAATLGVALAYPLVSGWMPRWIASNSGAILPHWDPGTMTYVMAVSAALATSVIAAAVPAWRAASIPVKDAMRHVG